MSDSIIEVVKYLEQSNKETNILLSGLIIFAVIYVVLLFKKIRVLAKCFSQEEKIYQHSSGLLGLVLFLFVEWVDIDFYKVGEITIFIYSFVCCFLFCMLTYIPKTKDMENLHRKSTFEERMIILLSVFFGLFIFNSQTIKPARYYLKKQYSTENTPYDDKLEKNNYVEDAKLIEMGCYLNLVYQNNDDWYLFSLDSDSRIDIVLDELTNQNKYFLDFYLYTKKKLIYTSTYKENININKEKEDKEIPNTSKKTYSFNLKRGKYYLCIARNDYGPFQFLTPEDKIDYKKSNVINVKYNLYCNTKSGSVEFYDLSENNKLDFQTSKNISLIFGILLSCLFFLTFITLILHQFSPKNLKNIRLISFSALCFMLCYAITYLYI